MIKRCALIASVLLVSCGKDKQEPTPKQDNLAAAVQKKNTTDIEPAGSLDGLEMVGETGLVRIEANGFKKLPVEIKKLAYYHYSAALASDAIYYGQLSPKHLAVKKVLDGIVAAGNRVPEQLKKKIEPYTKLFWINHGNHDSWTGAKISPKFIPGELAAATQVAIDMGIDLGVDEVEGLKLEANRLEQLEALLASIRPWVFDRSQEPVTLEENPPDDSGGEMVEQVMRTGREGVAEGLFAKELRSVVEQLVRGLSLMKPAEREAMQYLIDFFETGEPESLTEHKSRQASIEQDVKIVIGTVKQDINLRGSKGAFGAIVAVRDQEFTELMRGAAEQAAYFEQKMPWDDKFKRSPNELHPVVANAFQVVVATGEAGPASKVGVNFVNNSRIGERFGLPGLYLTNVVDALGRVRGAKTIPEFSVDKEVADRRKKCRQDLQSAHMVLREIIGPSMGKTSSTLAFGPKTYLKEFFRPLEEMRRDLIALNLSFDSKIREIGLVRDEECAMAMYDDYVSAMLEQLALIGDADTLVKARMQARQAVGLYAVKKGAVEVVEKGGHFFARVVDYQALRNTYSELLTEVQRIKSQGDYEAAKQLIVEYGTAVLEEWRKDVRSRFVRLALPRSIAFVYPLLVPHVNEAREITDVGIVHPKSLLERESALLCAK